MREPGWPQWAELLRANLLYQRVRATVNRRTHAAPTVQTSAPSTSIRTPVPNHPPVFDAKRAAAGERPDDE
ncbi:MAG: hypothetical protein EOP37_03345 [Rubrivivax sp.]|nr:MAG: hypothetical protein EOP37_03345 [Rubrivivax sp.]